MGNIKHENITILSGAILSEMNTKGRNWFTLGDATKAFSDLSAENYLNS